MNIETLIYEPNGKYVIWSRKQSHWTKS